jgi:predicted regulator of Ras-like GTPase activity (Roadblock/LC7/MglB family)
LPFQVILEGLLAEVPGALAALLLDETGEVAMEAGLRDHRHRLIGAYQAIALSAVRSVGVRHEAGSLQTLLLRYEGGSLVLRPLKDGYYLVVSVDPAHGPGRALDFSTRAQERLSALL